MTSQELDLIETRGYDRMNFADQYMTQTRPLDHRGEVINSISIDGKVVVSIRYLLEGRYLYFVSAKRKETKKSITRQSICRMMAIFDLIQQQHYAFEYAEHIRIRTSNKKHYLKFNTAVKNIFSRPVSVTPSTRFVYIVTHVNRYF